MYVLFSTDSDLDLLGNLIRRAGFAARLVAEQSIFIESFILYELRVHHGQHDAPPRDPNDENDEDDEDDEDDKDDNEDDDRKGRN